MTTETIKDNLISQIDKLPHDLQVRLFDIIKALTSKGVEGKSLLRFEGFIPSNDLQLMSKTIEENCEKVDNSEW